MIFLQSRNRDTDVENKLTDTKKEVGEGVDREAWCAVIHRVTKSRTRLSNWTELNCVCVLMTQLCPTLWNPWTVTHQAPLTMELSRQKYWSG